jgi:uncharacterized protein YprB with RNaseH-like and TPR domain
MKSWTPADDDVLRAGAKVDLSYLKIGRKLNRTTDSVRNRAFRLGLAKPIGVPWYDGLRIGFLDIETSNFEADAGSMLSWALKHRGGPLLSDLVTRKEEISCEFDKRIVGSLLEALEDIDVVVTYYGTGFDVPYLKTRALMLGLIPPGMGDLYHWDVYYTVKYKLKLHRKSLDVACEAFGIKGKSHLDLPIWNRARVGDEEALAYVLQHNKQDVRILERLFGKVERLAKWQRKPF